MVTSSNPKVDPTSYKKTNGYYEITVQKRNQAGDDVTFMDDHPLEDEAANKLRIYYLEEFEDINKNKIYKCARVNFYKGTYKLYISNFLPNILQIKKSNELTKFIDDNLLDPEAGLDFSVFVNKDNPMAPYLMYFAYVCYPNIIGQPHHFSFIGKTIWLSLVKNIASIVPKTELTNSLLSYILNHMRQFCYDVQCSLEEHAKSFLETVKSTCNIDMSYAVPTHMANGFPYSDPNFSIRSPHSVFEIAGTFATVNMLIGDICKLTKFPDFCEKFYELLDKISAIKPEYTTSIKYDAMIYKLMRFPIFILNTLTFSDLPPNKDYVFYFYTLYLKWCSFTCNNLYFSVYKMSFAVLFSKLLSKEKQKLGTATQKAINI